MTTIIERDVSNGSGDSSSSAMTALFAIVALAVVIGLIFFGLRAYPNGFGSTGTKSNSVDVNVHGTLPPAAPATPQQ